MVFGLFLTRLPWGLAAATALALVLQATGTLSDEEGGRDPLPDLSGPLVLTWMVYPIGTLARLIFQRLTTGWFLLINSSFQMVPIPLALMLMG